MDNSKNFFKSTVGIVVSLAVLGVTVWVISKAWKSGQK
jgi:predicted negative regulator of RcsB-dependent stress response